MRFLLDANMPHSALAAFEAQGHDAVHVRAIGLGDAEDEQVVAHASAEMRALVSRDLDFADVRRYPPESSPGYLVLRVPDTWIATQINGLLGRFLDMRELVDQIPGRLVILDSRQVRFRPALDMELRRDE